MRRIVTCDEKSILYDNNNNNYYYYYFFFFVGGGKCLRTVSKRAFTGVWGSQPLKPSSFSVGSTSEPH